MKKGSVAERLVSKTPTGNEIAVTMLGSEKFSKLDEKEKKKVAKSYSKQYKGSKSFRQAYENTFNDRYLKDFDQEEFKNFSDTEETPINKESRQYLEYLDRLQKGTARMSVSEDNARELIRQKKDPNNLSQEDYNKVMKIQGKETYDTLTGGRANRFEGQEVDQEVIKQGIVDRVGEKGLNALRFMSKDNNNLVSAGYLNTPMQAYIGDIGDTSSYTKYIKNPKNKYYDNLVKEMNKVYGTAFRNRADVAAFQSLMGIKVDGIIGPETEALLQYYYGQKNDGSNQVHLKNTKKMYKNQTNDQVYQNTLSKLFTNGQSESNVGVVRNPIFDGYLAPLALRSNNASTYSPSYIDWLRYYMAGSFQDSMEKYNEYLASQAQEWDKIMNARLPFNKQGGLIKKPSYRLKLQTGGRIPKYAGGTVVPRYGRTKSQTNQQKLAFAGDYYQSSYKALRSLGYDHKTCVRMAKFMTTHAAYESGYGASDLAIYNNNYGGFKVGKTSFRNMDEFTLAKAKLLRDSYPNTFKAQNVDQYVHALYNGVDGRKYCDPKDQVESAYVSNMRGTWDRSQYGIDYWLQSNSKTPNPNFVTNKKYH